MSQDFESKWTLLSSITTPVQELVTDLSLEKQVRLFVKRDDLLDAYVMGNKWRKLKYNLREAHRQGLDTVLTFGGAHSNHILATAAAGHYMGFKTIGVIRGEELSSQSNETLAKAAALGMHLYFVSREEYRRREHPEYWTELSTLFGEAYVIMEGGSGPLALQGVSEIVAELPKDYEYYCCSCGTGTTAAGLVSSVPASSHLLVLPSLKQMEEQKRSITLCAKDTSVIFNMDYVFGGYAKSDDNLTSFINDFPIPLDPVYTGKLFYGVYDLLKRDFFQKNTSILIYHSGGYRV